MSPSDLIASAALLISTLTYFDSRRAVKMAKNADLQNELPEQSKIRELLLMASKFDYYPTQEVFHSSSQKQIITNMVEIAESIDKSKIPTYASVRILDLIAYLKQLHVITQYELKPIMDQYGHMVFSLWMLWRLNQELHEKLISHRDDMMDFGKLYVDHSIYRTKLMFSGLDALLAEYKPIFDEWNRENGKGQST